MKFDLSELLESPPYGLASEQKRHLFEDFLSKLTMHHKENCPAYAMILNKLFNRRVDRYTLEKLPFIPVRLFKELTLKSIPDEQLFKVLKSSGTSGQQPSRIHIDRDVSEKQTRTLAKLTSNFIGEKRLPMLIIDAKKTLRDPKALSARGAGIIGFSLFGKNRTFALNEKMEPDMNTIMEFLDRFKGQQILLFGFTSILWEHFYERLSSQEINLEHGILIHGGGWKKLAARSVDNTTFKKSLNDAFGLKRIHNYYGMIEQTGSIFFECEEGCFHTSSFSDIIVRDAQFKSVEQGQKGLIQLLSLLPTSYPGHSILSEDVGEIIGEDDCPCGRTGKRFKVHGRIKKAEIRGCSDTFMQ